MKRYPECPGHRGQDTSVAAAEASSKRLAPLKARIETAFRQAGEKGLTTAGVEDKLGRRPNQRPFDPRVSELKAKGLIVDSGRRLPGRCGVQIKVWKAVPQPLAPNGQNNDS